MHFPQKDLAPFFLRKAPQKKPLLVRFYRMTDRENRRLYYSHVIHLKRKDIALQCSRENNNAILQA